MKKMLFVWLALGIVLFSSHHVLAAEGSDWIDSGEKEDVSIDKEWAITFSEPMDRGTLHSDSVYVIDENGERLFLSTYLSDDRKQLTVEPPADYYNPGESYTLYIKSDVKSQQGYAMKKGYKLEFTVDPKEEKPDNLPNDPDAEYFGTVTTEVLRVRAESNTDSEILGRVYKGEVIPVYDVEGFWVESEYEGQTAYLHKDYLKLRHVSGKLLEGLNIVIDAGHGGSDPGASENGSNEKDILLPVTLNVGERLERLGANVILTRDEDKFLSLDQRVALSRSYYNDLFVSIHANIFSNENAYGAETYYSDEKGSNVEQGYYLAQDIQEQMAELAEMHDRGVKEKDFRVIYKNESPAALLELGFMSNPSDYEKLMSSDYRYLFADAITQGIIDYFKR
ncbi:N-acetylmuramoyl-L-alanine amidase [Tenuibacillus multivorans]|uniref:N-acetylmuramoyl-L-alanine amidase n=1 Tax=Tenuibacillus multivorans TaxID=237069 RepID=A0A1H0G6M2_9BACI|nr:N-acetylmuramoyl-L-alanine amidase [Tenuibacillus multivorans]GEL78726.1 hypothetical protein TMU01_29610 [Tenuibacillus multivorans]SDO02399.1 N-acetylmuramoyl-L-alanine amidase [Tenuibacillus multivorans]